MYVLCIYINVHIWHIHIHIIQRCILHFTICILHIQLAILDHMSETTEKSTNLRIRDVSGLLCALHASGHQSLNAKLRSVGQKPFHWRTLQVGAVITKRSIMRSFLETLRFITLNVPQHQFIDSIIVMLFSNHV